MVSQLYAKQKPVASFGGLNGVLEVYDLHLIFKRIGPTVWMLPGDRVKEEIPYDDLLDIHLVKPSAALTGYFWLVRKSEPHRPIIMLFRNRDAERAESVSRQIEEIISKLGVALIMKRRDRD